MDRKEVKLYRDNVSAEAKARKNELLRKLNFECVTREERAAVFRELTGALGKNLVDVTPPFYCDYGTNIFIGDWFFSNNNLTILDCAKVTIGNNVFIASNVGIYAVGHPIDPVIRNTGLEYGAPVVIGNNVWIGGHVVINPGVTIGDNVVIGSGSVVTHDIEPNTVAAGNPCRPIRKLDERDKKYYFKDFEYEDGLVDSIYAENNENN